MDKWTAAQCAEFCGVGESTWRSYVARIGAPKPLSGFNEQKQRLWNADKVKAWHESRRGEGWRKGSGKG